MHYLVDKTGTESDESVLVFVHVPKCGGTTVRRHIIENLPPEACFETTAEVKDSIEEVAASVRALPADRRARVRVVFGHGAYYGIHELFDKRGEYVTLLRNPVDRALSEYNYQRMCYEAGRKCMGASVWEQKQGEWAFADWLREYPVFRNGMTRFLAMILLGKYRFGDDAISPQNVEAIKAILDTFRFVGLTENEEDFLWLYRRLGVQRFLPRQNLSRKYYAPTNRAEIEALVSRFDDIDRQLYDYARRLHGRRRKERVRPRPAALLERLRRGLAGAKGS
jgi:hypothetical protein